jgi:uroporphyrin-III C-methyltransferase/precorrin-2 dehydrogenase/sirohydrochlorin ferrochelatase
MRKVFPLFLDLTGRDVLLVGGGRVAAGKLRQLIAAGARVRVVSPLVLADINRASRGVQSPGGRPQVAPVVIVRRGFEPGDLEGAWLVVAAATPEVNRAVAKAAEARRIFVNAVDDPDNATAYLSGVVRRDEVTLAISTGGEAPALTSLMREALDAVLPDDLADWVAAAREQRLAWRRDGVPMAARKPLLLRALNELYVDPRGECVDNGVLSPRQIPWLSGPEDSWL